MNTQVANRPAGGQAIAERDMIDVLRSSLYPGASDDSIRMVVSYCAAAGLDPMLKPVHIVPMYDKKSEGMRDVIMPGIGHYRVQASRSNCHVGTSEPEFGPMKTEKLGSVEVTYPEWCRVTVSKLIDGKVCTFTATEYWLENYATQKKGTQAPNSMWLKRPRGQLAKCSEAQALRKGWPELTGSEPTAEEMMGKPIDYIESEPLPRSASQRLDDFSGGQSTEQRLDDEIPDHQKPTEDDPGEADPPQERSGPSGPPKMPLNARAQWENEGKWLGAWRWLQPQLKELPKRTAQELLIEHAELVKKVHAHNAGYARAVTDLIESRGLVLNLG